MKKSGPKSLCDRFKEMSYSDRTVRSTLSRLNVSGWLHVILFYAMFSIWITEVFESIMASIIASKPALPNLFLS